MGLAAGVSFPALAQAAKVKVGVLHSLTGTMAISETLLKDTALMAIDAINRAGGVMGRQVEAVVVDPKSDPALFARMAEDLFAKEHVSAIFGCWTSNSRKSVLPVLDKVSGLLFYPVQYEGQEQHARVIYTGCTPNQQALPAADFLLSPAAGARKRFVLMGSDYVYPRTTNNVLKNYLQKKGVKAADILEVYRPLGHSGFADAISQAKEFGKGEAAIISTINGDSNLSFFRDLARSGIKAAEMPVMAFSVGEEELRDVDTSSIAGHFASWPYFMNNSNAMNRDFIAQWGRYAKEKNIPRHSEKPIVNDPMQATWVGVHLWKQAAEQAKSVEVAKVIAAVNSQVMPAPSGALARMDATNHHLFQTPMVGRVRADGQFDVVWRAKEAVRAEPMSTYMS